MSKPSIQNVIPVGKCVHHIVVNGPDGITGGNIFAQSTMGDIFECPSQNIGFNVSQRLFIGDLFGMDTGEAVQFHHPNQWRNNVPRTLLIYENVVGTVIPRPGEPATSCHDLPEFRGFVYHRYRSLAVIWITDQ